MLSNSLAALWQAWSLVALDVPRQGFCEWDCPGSWDWILPTEECLRAGIRVLSRDPVCFRCTLGHGVRHEAFRTGFPTMPATSSGPHPCMHKHKAVNVLDPSAKASCAVEKAQQVWEAQSLTVPALLPTHSEPLGKSFL